MKQAFIQIRLSQGEKTSIQKAAEYFGESVSEFIRRGALLRLKQGKSEAEADPFLHALRELTRGQAPEPIPPDVANLLAESRKQGLEGKDFISPGEAAQMIRKKIEVLNKKKK